MAETSRLNISAIVIKAVHMDHIEDFEMLRLRDAVFKIVGQHPKLIETRFRETGESRESSCDELGFPLPCCVNPCFEGETDARDGQEGRAFPIVFAPEFETPQQESDR